MCCCIVFMACQERDDGRTPLALPLFPPLPVSSPSSSSSSSPVTGMLPLLLLFPEYLFCTLLFFFFFHPLCFSPSRSLSMIRSIPLSFPSLFFSFSPPCFLLVCLTLHILYILTLSTSLSPSPSLSCPRFLFPSLPSLPPLTSPHQAPSPLPLTCSVPGR